MRRRGVLKGPSVSRLAGRNACGRWSVRIGEIMNHSAGPACRRSMLPIKSLQVAPGPGTHGQPC
jgi:hypothetical protein